MFEKLKWLVVSGVAMVGLMGGVAMAQTASGAEFKNAPATVAAGEKKPPVAEVAIPEARLDKVKIMVLERQVALDEVEQLKATVREIDRRGKELEALIGDKTSKLQVEMTSALKLAGVEEKEHQQYQLNLQTLKIIKVEPPAAKPPATK